MSVQVEKLEHNMAKLTIEVAVDEFEKAVEKAYHQNKNKISIPGFRKGKVSRQVMEKMYGKEVFFQDAANIAIPEAYEKAYDEVEEEIVSSPEIEVTQIEAGKPFIFTATVALNPEATLGQYKGVEVEKFDTTVSDEEVEEKINRELEQQARFESVVRPAENGDQVVIDFEGFVDGVAFDGGKAENHTLTLGSGTFIPGFEDQIVGKQPGDAFDVTVTFPEDYHAEDLAGKEAVFKCVLHETKEKQVPVLNDAFAEEKGCDTVDEYRQDVRNGLELKKRDEMRAQKEDAVLEAIVANAEMDVPEAMIKTRLHQRVDDFAQRLRMQGLSLEQYFQFTGLNEEMLMEQSREGVEKSVKARIALEAVVKAENITASDDDYEEEIRKMADEYSMEVENIKNMLGEKEAAQIRKDLAIRKAVDLVVEQAVEK